MHIKIEAISLPFEKPFTITGATYTSCDTIRLTVDNGTHQGIGEAIGVDYMGESIDSIIAQLEAIQSDLANGADHESIQTLLPPGGARNALDCALWDLAAKREGKRVWDFLGMSVSPVQTVFTIGIDEPETMAAGAAQAKALPHLKIKLDADRPIEKLEAIRAVRPDATFIVDANQGWDIHLLKDILPRLEQLDIALLEQPLRRGDDEDLRGLETRIPIGADESLQHIGEFPHIAEIYDVVNIKLDKCGGLTEALQIVRLCQEHNKRLMVGCMVGTSYSMAPAFIVAQHCEFVDIDGPLLLAEDVAGGMEYGPTGIVQAPEVGFWG